MAAPKLAASSTLVKMQAAGLMRAKARTISSSAWPSPCAGSASSTRARAALKLKEGVPRSRNEASLARVFGRAAAHA